jgi:phosphatidylinositol alpha-1,6-mannosyltransferase
MRQLLITSDYPPNNPGGMTNYYRGLVGHLPGRVNVLTVQTPGGPEYDGASLVPTLRLRPSTCWLDRLGGHRRWYHAARRLVERRGVELVHCGNASPYRWVVQRLWRKTATPFVIYFHGNDVARAGRRLAGSPFHSRSWRRIADACSAFVVNSAYTARLARKLLPISADDVVVCHPGVDDAFLGLQYTAVLDHAGPPRLLGLGRLLPRKGFDTVIRALALLKRRGLEVHYRLAGGGDQAPYRRLAAQHGVAEQVEFLGFVDDDYIPDLLRWADAFSMVSRLEDHGTDVEGFGIVYLEAGALGRPVIAGRSGGVEDAVLDGRTGLLVDDPGSPAAVAAALEQLLRHPNLARRLGHNGYERVNGEFNWDRLAGRLYDNLRRRLENRRAEAV